MTNVTWIGLPPPEAAVTVYATPNGHGCVGYTEAERIGNSSSLSGLYAYVRRQHSKPVAIVLPDLEAALRLHDSQTSELVFRRMYVGYTHALPAPPPLDPELAAIEDLLADLG